MDRLSVDVNRHAKIKKSKLYRYTEDGMLPGVYVWDPTDRIIAMCPGPAAAEVITNALNAFYIKETKTTKKGN